MEISVFWWIFLQFMLNYRRKGRISGKKGLSRKGVTDMAFTIVRIIAFSFILPVAWLCAAPLHPADTFKNRVVTLRKPTEKELPAVSIHTLGTGAGTEPLPTRQYASCLFEVNGKLYLFDAGSGSCRTAHLSGIDITKIRTVFISHPHRDHVGGLPDFFWNIRKLVFMRDLATPEITVFVPEMKMWDAVFAMTKLGGISRMAFEPRLIADGTIFDDGNVKVEARHNHHIQRTKADVYTSFSFRITAGKRKIVYSGDVKTYHDMGDWLDDCDLLMIETGHYKASDICAGLRKDGAKVKEIMFVHSGREIINDCEGARGRAEKAWGKPVVIAEDGCTYVF
jgi:ribonuclease BN (tRNA processing enzyme)